MNFNFLKEIIKDNTTPSNVTVEVFAATLDGVVLSFIILLV
jgi:hypothetical protein